jgi:hypothetical protein
VTTDVGEQDDMSVVGGASFFEDKLPFASSPPPPPSTPLRHGFTTSTPLKRKIGFRNDESPAADSPALSRLAKRMARSSMSSPRKPDFNFSKTAASDQTNAAQMEGIDEARSVGENEVWEDDQNQWGDDAMLEWNAPSDRVEDQMSRRTTPSVGRAKQSTVHVDLDWSIGSPQPERPAAPVRRPPPKMVRSPKVVPLASAQESTVNDVPASPIPEPSKDPIQALMDRGMPDYASWTVPDLQVGRAWIPLPLSLISSVYLAGAEFRRRIWPKVEQDCEHND